MPWLAVVYLLVLFLGAAVSLTVAVFAWRRRHVAPYLGTFAVWLAALAVWSVCYLNSLLSPGYAEQAFWFRALYLGSALMAPASLVFALQFTGHGRWVTPRLLALLAAEPLITGALIATNDAHGLFWSAFGPAPSGAFPALAYTRGDWGQIRLFLIYLEHAGATLLLLASLHRSPPLHRRQTLGLTVATIIPWIASLLTTSGLSPLGRLDLTPGGLGLMVIIWTLDLLRQGLFNIVPAARYAVIEDMQDAVFVVNAQRWVVDANPEALRLLGRGASDCTGRPAAEVFSGWPALLDLVRDSSAGSAELLLALGDGPEARVYEFRLSGWSDAVGRPLGRLIVGHDVTARQRAEEALQRQAHYDALTGLPNRTLLALRLDEALQQAAAAGTTAALLIMDLNGFKEVNDTFGHQVGDLLLSEVGQRLQEAAPVGGVAARLGGDEFAIVAPASAGDPMATHLALHLLAALDQPVMVEGMPLVIGASVGIALYPEHGDAPGLLMRRADVAMYAAKRLGGGFAVYDPAVDDNSPGRLAMLSDLRGAIAAGDLVLYYQPQISLADGAISGVEALVRWRRPGHGLLPPDQFIALAERSGLIQPLTRWVMAEALRQGARWRAEGFLAPIAVNLSVANLRDALLPAEIERLLALWETPPGGLTLELTENVVMSDPDQAQQALHRLRALGVRIALDDFGIGQSSLAWLHSLPVDEIKIDKSFVLELTAGDHGAAIAQLTVELGHHFGLHVVAEGVDSSETLRWLRSLGCDVAQGYMVCPPLPAAALLEWAKARV